LWNCTNIGLAIKRRLVNVEGWVMAVSKAFGELFHSLRIKTDLTLRKFCEKYSFDPGNLSRLERGLMPPPNEDILKVYAAALGLKENSKEYTEFIDLGASCAGRLPQDVLEDEELVKMLPVVFRTLKGKRVDEATLRELAEKIRRA